jgi:hypothetical protein
LTIFVFDWVHTFNRSIVLNLRASATRYIEDASTGAGLNFDLTELGFPQSLADQVPAKIFPRIELGDGYIRLGRGQYSTETTNVFSFQPNIIWMRGNLTIRSGFDMRYTQYGSITMTEMNGGRSWYNSMQVVANRRLANGFSVNASYTFSKAMERVPATVTSDYRLSRGESRGLASEDRPHRITLAGIFYLPIGRDKRFFRGMPRALNAVFGGWEMAGAVIRESGRPWDFPNPEDNVPIAYIGGGELSKSERSRWLNGVEYLQVFRPCVGRRNNTRTSPTYRQYLLTPSSIANGCTSANFRVIESYETYDAPLRDSRFRRPSFTQIDVNFAKNWKFKENHKLQLRVEAFNLFNTPMYNRINYNRDVNSAEFGLISKSTQRQNNFPRQFQLAVKYNF